MFRWIAEKLSGKKRFSADYILAHPEGRRIYRDQHPVRKQIIDNDAAKVIQRLQQFGHKAYIVGGGIRDLLLGKKPKDYDVVTNALPAEIRKIFGNSRMIGKRFRIVHVVFRGNKIIEVSTARSIPENRKTASNEDELYLKKDNQFGSFKEDVARRDFTVNALLFDLRNESIIDYAGGYDDLKNRVLKIIGDPDISLPEDPVRMLRAIKFAGLLELEIDPELFKAIRKHGKLIKKASKARLHEEYNKIFRTGQTFQIMQQLIDSGLMESMFPSIFKESVGNDQVRLNDTLLGQRLLIADTMIQEHEEVNTTIYFALFLIDYLSEDLEKSKKRDSKITADKFEIPAEELGLTKKEVERLEKIFSSQRHFYKEVSERKGWVNEFKNRSYFEEAFIIYKIRARSMQDDEAIQKALFWEIGLRNKLNQAIRKERNRSIELNPSTEKEQTNKKARPPRKPRRPRRKGPKSAGQRPQKSPEKAD